MPMLKFKGIETEKVCAISNKLIDELQELMQYPRNYFSLTVDKFVYIKDGEIVNCEPMVEVLWFDRGQEVRNKAAKIITKYVHSLEYQNVDIIFFTLDENKYYKNGEHL